MKSNNNDKSSMPNNRNTNFSRSLFCIDDYNHNATMTNTITAIGDYDAGIADYDVDDDDDDSGITITQKSDFAGGSISFRQKQEQKKEKKKKQQQRQRHQQQQHNLTAEKKMNDYETQKQQRHQQLQPPNSSKMKKKTPYYGNTEVILKEDYDNYHQNTINKKNEYENSNKLTATVAVTAATATATATTDDSIISAVAVGSTTFVSASPSHSSIITRARSSLRRSPPSERKLKSKFFNTSRSTTNTNNNRSSSDNDANTSGMTVTTTETFASSTMNSRIRLLNCFSSSKQHHYDGNDYDYGHQSRSNSVIGEEETSSIMEDSHNNATKLRTTIHTTLNKTSASTIAAGTRTSTAATGTSTALANANATSTGAIANNKGRQKQEVVAAVVQQEQDEKITNEILTELQDEEETLHKILMKLHQEQEQEQNIQRNDDGNSNNNADDDDDIQSVLLQQSQLSPYLNKKPQSILKKNGVSSVTSKRSSSSSSKQQQPQPQPQSQLKMKPPQVPPSVLSFKTIVTQNMNMMRSTSRVSSTKSTPLLSTASSIISSSSIVSATPLPLLLPSAPAPVPVPVPASLVIPSAASALVRRNGHGYIKQHQSQTQAQPEARQPLRGPPSPVVNISGSDNEGIYRRISATASMAKATTPPRGGGTSGNEIDHRIHHRRSSSTPLWLVSKARQRSYNTSYNSTNNLEHNTSSPYTTASGSESNLRNTGRVENIATGSQISAASSLTGNDYNYYYDDDNDNDDYDTYSIGLSTIMGSEITGMSSDLVNIGAETIDAKRQGEQLQRQQQHDAATAAAVADTTPAIAIKADGTITDTVLKPRCHFCGEGHWIYNCPFMNPIKKDDYPSDDEITTNSKMLFATTINGETDIIREGEHEEEMSTQHLVDMNCNGASFANAASFNCGFINNRDGKGKGKGGQG
jgi:hypothetical protein